MPTYISLVSYTNQEIRTTKDSPTCMNAAKKLLQEAGGELKDFYPTSGSYDLIITTEAPNREVVAEFLRALISGGKAQTSILEVSRRGRIWPTAVPSQLGAVHRSGVAELSSQR